MEAEEDEGVESYSIDDLGVFLFWIVDCFIVVWMEQGEAAIIDSFGGETKVDNNLIVNDT